MSDCANCGTDVGRHHAQPLLVRAERLEKVLRGALMDLQMDNDNRRSFHWTINDILEALGEPPDDPGYAEEI